MVDYIYGLFVEAVARNRGANVEDVLKNMTDGRVFIGQQAVDAGLIDRIESIDEVIKNLAGGGNQKTGGIKAMTEEGAKVKTEQLPPVTADSLKRDFPATISEITAEAKQAALAEGYEKGKSEGAEAERSRISGIRAITMKGFELFMDTLIADGKATPADAAYKQTLEMKSRGGTTVEQIAADSPQPVSFAQASEGRISANGLPEDALARKAQEIADAAKGGR